MSSSLGDWPLSNALKLRGKFRRIQQKRVQGNRRSLKLLIDFPLQAVRIELHPGKMIALRISSSSHRESSAFVALMFELLPQAFLALGCENYRFISAARTNFCFEM